MCCKKKQQKKLQPLLFFGGKIAKFDAFCKIWGSFRIWLFWNFGWLKKTTSKKLTEVRNVGVVFFVVKIMRGGRI